MLIDSNIIIYGSNTTDPRLDAILSRGDLSISSVTLIEVFGYHQLTLIQKRWLAATISRMDVIDLEKAIVHCAITLRQQRRLGLADAIIAATAFERKLPLVTRNVSDFQNIVGLRVIDPLAGK